MTDSLLDTTKLSILPAHVLRHFNPENQDACWLWQGTINKGYGRAWYRSTTKSAHRLIYETLIGPIPPGMTLDHKCLNKACVNPNHLDPVTTEENSQRHFAAREFCRNNHRMTPENTYTPPGRLNIRQCRTCQAERDRAFKARRKNNG